MSEDHLILSIFIILMSGFGVLFLAFIVSVFIAEHKASKREIEGKKSRVESQW